MYQLINKQEHLLIVLHVLYRPLPLLARITTTHVHSEKRGREWGIVGKKVGDIGKNGETVGDRVHIMQ